MATVADLGNLQRLPKIIGSGHTAELAYTGKDIDAAGAAASGSSTSSSPTPRRPGRGPGDGRRDRRQLAVGRAGNQGGPDRRRGPAVAEGLDYVAT